MADADENQQNLEINDPPSVENWHIDPKVGHPFTIHMERLELNSV